MREREFIKMSKNCKEANDLEKQSDRQNTLLVIRNKTIKKAPKLNPASDKNGMEDETNPDSIMDREAKHYNDHDEIHLSEFCGGNEDSTSEILQKLQPHFNIPSLVFETAPSFCSSTYFVSANHSTLSSPRFASSILDDREACERNTEEDAILENQLLLNAFLKKLLAEEQAKLE